MDEYTLDLGVQTLRELHAALVADKVPCTYNKAHLACGPVIRFDSTVEGGEHYLEVDEDPTRFCLGYNHQCLECDVHRVDTDTLARELADLKTVVERLKK